MMNTSHDMLRLAAKAIGLSREFRRRADALKAGGDTVSVARLQRHLDRIGGSGMPAADAADFDAIEAMLRKEIAGETGLSRDIAIYETNGADCVCSTVRRPRLTRRAEELSELRGILRAWRRAQDIIRENAETNAELMRLLK